MNTCRRYILVGHRPQPEPDSRKWAQWFETADRHVEQTFVGKWKVSTVFLGINHSFSSEGPPMLFETMVFIDQPHECFGYKGKWTQDDSFPMVRYSTWEQAEAGHKRILDLVRDRQREQAN